MYPEELFELLETEEEEKTPDIPESESISFLLNIGRTMGVREGFVWAEAAKEPPPEPAFDPDRGRGVKIRKCLLPELPKEILEKKAGSRILVSQVLYVREDPRYQETLEERQQLEDLSRAERKLYLEIHKKVWDSHKEFQQVPEEAYFKGPSIYARALCPESVDLDRAFTMAFWDALHANTEYMNNPFNELDWYRRNCKSNASQKRWWELQNIHPYRVVNDYWFGVEKEGTYSWFYKMDEDRFHQILDVLYEKGFPVWFQVGGFKIIL